MVAVTCRPVLLLYFVSLFISVLGTEHVPVLIWESSASSQRETRTPPYLTKLSSDGFSDYFKKRVPSHNSETKPVIAVFLEENLSVEDFSWKDVEEQGSFPQLENLTSQASKVDFLPSVHAPLKGLKKLGYRWQVYNSINDVGESLSDEGGVVVVVKLGDANLEESRPHFLRRHDDTITNIYSLLLTHHSDVIGVYTSHHSSWIDPDNKPSLRRVRSLLAVDGAGEESNATFWHDENNNIFIYYTPELPPVLNLHSINDSQNLNLTGGEYSIEILNDEQIFIANFTINYTKQINISLDNQLQTKTEQIALHLKFPVSYSDYWSLSEVEFEGMGTTLLLKTSSDIHAPVGFSYHCGSEIVFRNESITLTFTNVQIQPYLKGETKFGDSYDCVWFFTVPIWSGLFVTTILAFIIILALTMIMNIKPMDKFDDPKGKTITIIE